ncbi:hypothetical protein OCAE111667_08425 [Occultella aeris]|uniref:N-acetyltransferase domain-containing protein n=1 Tax=Occultella aeris TaxID=2761496 RepID=A0A7M4DK90_9MICO|nr:hypothetical protein [Occultella aeris]VZO37484.1 hypothetical protein HALOF300_02553 [Occultella aeris]
MQVRPATHADVEMSRATFDDLLPDRWRGGNNRRSFVAVDPAGRVLGHCRGIDNDFHPASRVLVLEVLPDVRGQGVDDELLRVQVAVSSPSLHLKLTEPDRDLRALTERHGGVAIQAMPPWRYVVGPELRAWAAAQPRPEGSVGPIRDTERDEALGLFLEHYTVQHAAWSPAAPMRRLRAEFVADFTAGSHTAFDPLASVALRRDGRLVAQALLYPPDPEDPTGGRELGLQSRPYAGPDARADLGACLAAVIGLVPDGAALLIDSHLTERAEYRMMEEVPGPAPGGSWTAIVAIGVPGGKVPVPLPRDLLPEDAAWIRGMAQPDS